MTDLLKRCGEIYSRHGVKGLLTKSYGHIKWQLSERIFGSYLYFKFRSFINSIRYNTVADPYKITYVDPEEIQYFSARGEQTNRNIEHTRWKDIGRVMGGDWDLESISSEYRIERSKLYQAIKSHFEHGVPWNKTDYIEHAVEQINSGNEEEVWRAVVQSERDLWERCRQLDTLYDEICSNGYKSKSEVFDAKSGDPMGYYPETYKHRIDEVMIDRGRDGQPLLVDGRHRVFIAKCCDIEEIPVVVVVRHQEYVDQLC